MFGLDLFSGIGGITKALEPWVVPIAYCEIDHYAQATLLSRMADGDIKTAPIWDDVTTLRGENIPIQIDIIYGGFPCQDISTAGFGKGLEGERSGLFREICRLVKEIQPPFVFLENVPAIRTRGLREVVRAFTDMGYDCRWTSVSAREVDACHLRKRWFLLAYSNRNGLFKQAPPPSEIQPIRWTATPSPISGWEGIEPRVRGVDDEIPFRVDRVKALGNGVVPSQVRKAFKKLIGLNDE
jgi:DNA (cytosine-5)-methyltransferase 1